ncbi:MAG: tRNA pseudouridine(55) synthase TruB [Chloroflexi bacterium]|nr:tRNA pseudouridine(55) synthase TruB [Chloroflexota bacterium]
MPRVSRGAAEVDLDGILVLAKPAGPTSHDIVALVRRLSGVRRVGHGGTLDPFAAGVLPVFIGRATRVVEYHLSDEKAYRAVVAFGARSTTDDLEGELTPGEVDPPTREMVEAALEPLRGTIEQVPPDYSAVRVAGRRAYELARHGKKPELKSRRVEIHELTMTAWDGSDAERPTSTLEIRCSAGTYIRAIARDLGETLGSGAYLVALTRTASGPFTIDKARSVDQLRDAATAGRLRNLLVAPDTGLDAIPRLRLGPDDLGALSRGQVVRVKDASLLDGLADGLLRVVDGGGRLAAMARLEAGRLHPEKVFVGPGA